MLLFFMKARRMRRFDPIKLPFRRAVQVVLLDINLRGIEILQLQRLFQAVQYTLVFSKLNS